MKNMRSLCGSRCRMRKMLGWLRFGVWYVSHMFSICDPCPNTPNRTPTGLNLRSRLYLRFWPSKVGFGMRTGMGRTGRSATWPTVTIWENHGQHLGVVAGESERVTLQRCWHVWIHNFFLQLSNPHAKFCDMYIEQVAWATAARRVLHFWPWVRIKEWITNRLLHPSLCEGWWC
jgi:hypothetical protein